MNHKNLRLAIALLCLFGLAACGSGGPDLSPAAAEGREVARSNGCAACHGSNGEGGVGPAWVGLAGSQVELADGSTVAANAEYLQRSIIEPDADIVAGYTTKMPAKSLDGDQVEAIVTYIQELSE